MLAEAQEQAAGKEAVLKALDLAAVSLRGKLGESLSSAQKYDTPLSNATTPSLEALKAYSLGHKALFAKGDIAALPFYKRAVELDPKFAMVYSAISVNYSNLNEAGIGVCAKLMTCERRHGRLAAGRASRYRGLARKAEKRARTDPPGDGFGGAQRGQRDLRKLSGSGGVARSGSGKSRAGTH